jgi:hypothetical protein
MIFIDEPQPVALSDYEAAINAMTAHLKNLPGLLSVYQIGGFGAPGISDIDMVAVFEDGFSTQADPQAYLTGHPRYLFCHQLFGTSRSFFNESRLYTSFHNYRLLHGEELRDDVPELDSQTENLMQKQLAHEFLIRMWINMIVERGYGVYKVRNLLLQGNGLRYDLEFLKANPKDFSACLDTIMKWRACWFENRPKNGEIAELYATLYETLKDFFTTHFETETLYLPDLEHYKLGRNITLKQGKDFADSKSGFTLPWMPKKLARKVLSLQSRYVQFDATMPFTSETIPEHIERSFDYTRRAWGYNRQNLPYYMPLTSSLVLQ